VDVVEVNGARDWKAFVFLPRTIYRNDPLWIQPLWSEQKKLFSPKHLENYEYSLFLVKDCGKVLGRSAVFIDRHYNEYWKEKTGFFGSFECVNDIPAALILMRSCEEWLKQRQMDAMRGPINFESQNWGVICDGYGDPPKIMSPYNPPYYNDLLQSAGLAGVKHLEVFSAETENYQLPERYTRHFEHLMRKYALQVRHVNMKRLVDDIRVIVDLSNRSLFRNWGYAPVSLDEAEEIAADLRRIVRPELVLIVESRGIPIGFSIALPDIYRVLKDMNGRLLPFGIFTLLRGLRKIDEFRMWALGIVPEFQRKGIDTMLYLATYRALCDRKIRLEANYILENNYAMKDAVIKLGMKKVRTYRIYEKKIDAVPLS